MRQTIEHYVHLYNRQLPQSALHSRTPMQEMRRWYDEMPELFHRQPKASNRPGCVTKYQTVVHGDVLVDDKPAVTGSRQPAWRHVIFDQPCNRQAAGPPGRA